MLTRNAPKWRVASRTPRDDLLTCSPPVNLVRGRRTVTEEERCTRTGTTTLREVGDVLFSGVGVGSAGHGDVTPTCGTRN